MVHAVGGVHLGGHVDVVQGEGAFVVDLLNHQIQLAAPVRRNRAVVHEVVDHVFQVVHVVLAVGAVEGRLVGEGEGLFLVVVEEDAQVWGVQRALRVRSRPADLRVGGGQEVFATRLEDVQLAPLVAVGDLLLERVGVAGVDAVLQTRGRRAAHVGHGHQAHLVELVELVRQVQEGVPLVGGVGARVVVVAVQSEAVAFDAASSVTTVLAAFVVVEVLAPLQSHDVAERTAKQLGLVAQAQAVAPVQRRSAAVDGPRVGEALADGGEVAVDFLAEGHHAFGVQGVQTLAAAEVDEFAVVVVELGQHLGDAGLAWAVADAALDHAQFVELVAVAEVDQRVKVVGALLVGPHAGGQSSHFAGQAAAPVVEAEPVGGAGVGRQDILHAGLVVEAHRGAVVQGQVLREVLGVHADVGAGPVAWEVGGLGLDDDQVVHQVGGKEVHLDAVASGVHGRHLCAVQGGLDVAVAQSAYEDEVAHGAHAGDTLDCACGVAVAGLLDLLAAHEVHARRALLLDVLHVHVARAVHLGHDLRSLLDHVRFNEEVEVQQRHAVRHGDRGGLGRVADEASCHFVRPWGQTFQRVVAVEVRHGALVRVHDHDVGADEGFAGLGVGHRSADGSLGECGGEQQALREEREECFWHDPGEFFAKVSGTLKHLGEANVKEL